MPEAPPRTNKRASAGELIGADTSNRDEEGRLILGNPSSVCPWCGETAEVNYSECGRVALWHAPTACCDERFKVTRQAEVAAAQEKNDDERTAKRWRLNR